MVQNKFLSKNWSYGFLESLQKLSLEIEVCKAFDGIYYKVKNSQPNDPIFITSRPQTDAKNDFIRTIKTEARQIPKNAKGVIIIDSSLNFGSFQGYISMLDES
jgi:hypothetical protein